ncbi:MAG: TonB-dependent receptor [Puniceicoccaceae bacterium]
MTIQKIIPASALAALLLTNLSAANESEVYELDPLIVRGDLLQGPIEQLPASASIIQVEDTGLNGAGHLEDLLGQLPNLNWAGGTSRPRFFQIRGIGESSQFGNEIPASSVGVIVDGIDMTGIGGVAGLLDVERVEVLRGPQAAAFGANALAGLILVETTAPSATTNGKLEMSVGDHDLFSLGAAAGGSLDGTGDSSLSYRISAQMYQDNGYRENRFLGRDDTNERDEKTARLKLNWDPSSPLEIDLTLLYFDFQNGYDAWSLTNNSFITTTDEPGMDSQETKAAGLRAKWQATESVDISYSASVSDSDLLYSFDWDWSNPEELMELYGPVVYWGTDVTERTRTVWSHDLRATSRGYQDEDQLFTKWAAGLYHRDFEEEQVYFGVNSLYAMETTAAYAQARVQIGDAIGLTLAGRLEDVSIDYSNDYGVRLKSSDQPWGGKLALEYRTSPENLLYVSIDRGFKAGGVNLDDDVPDAFRIYGTETLWNYEAGWKGFLLGRSLRTQLTAFYMDRSDIQVDSSVQLGDGNTFALYKDNAASGNNYGFELELDWRVNANLRLHASLGLLETEFSDYRYIDPNDGQTEIVLDGRQQAYAPSYTYAIGGEYTFAEGFFAGAQLEGRDAYLFDVANDQSLQSYNLLHLHLGYRAEAWSVSVWMRNALDKGYAAHGFFFANEPPNYDNPRRWISEGAPRQIGVSARFAF